MPAGFSTRKLALRRWLACALLLTSLAGSGVAQAGGGLAARGAAGGLDIRGGGPGDFSGAAIHTSAFGGAAMGPFPGDGPAGARGPVFTLHFADGGASLPPFAAGSDPAMNSLVFNSAWAGGAASPRAAGKRSYKGVIIAAPEPGTAVLLLSGLLALALRRRRIA